MTTFATLEDIAVLFRPLTEAERPKAEALLPIVSNALRMEADKVGKDLDLMAVESPWLADVAKSVVVDIVGRTLNSSTTAEPMTQTTQSALGYSVSGTYLSPGGGLYIKKSELSRLGLRRQRVGFVDMMGGGSDD